MYSQFESTSVDGNRLKTQEQLIHELCLLHQQVTRLEALQSKHWHLEKELRASEEQFRQIAETIQDAFWLTDVKNRTLLYVSPAYERIWGRSCQSLYEDPESLIDAIHPNDRPAVMERLEQTPDQEFEIEYRIVRPDGSVRWVWEYGFPIYDTTGKIYRHSRIARDVTDRKQSEVSLRESEHYYRQLFENNPQPMWVIDPVDLTFLAVNQAAIGHYGYSEAEFLQMTLQEICLPEDVPALVEVTSAPKKALAQAGIWRHCKKDGTVIFVEISSRSLEIAGRSAELLLVNDVSDRKRIEERLQRFAFYDSITGFLNRLGFLEQIQERFQSREKKIAVLCLALDRFETIQYSLGHFVAEELVIAVSQRLLEYAPGKVAIGRVNTDKFAVLLDGFSREAVLELAEHFYHAMNLPFDLGQHEIFSPVNIGVVFSAIGYQQAEDFLQAADIAIHRSRHFGKVHYTVFDTTMQIQEAQRLQMDADLRRALDREELELYYQPILSLETHEMVGLEALLRWNHPQQGRIMPGDFIPLAEETGLIVPLGVWILRQACLQLRHWQTLVKGDLPLFVSVNLSAVQLGQPGLLEYVDQVLHNTGLKPQQLKLEITETILVENRVRGIQVLEQFRERSLQLCLDDFGTGYSALSYLQVFPVNILKIDRKFVTQMAEGLKNIEIIRTIIQLAHTLDMEVTAEGIETPEQLAQLKALGCEYGQGHLFSKALSAITVEQVITGEQRLEDILC